MLLSLAAIGLLVSPAGRSRGAREQEYERLRMEKIEKTRPQLHSKAWTRRLLRLAKKRHNSTASGWRSITRRCRSNCRASRAKPECNVSTVKYDEHTDKSTPSGFDSIGITIQVQGSYAQDMRFINAVERQKMMLLIDAITFGGMQGDTLTVSVHMSTFLRSAA